MRIRLLKHVGWVSDSATQHKNIGPQKAQTQSNNFYCVRSYLIGI